MSEKEKRRQKLIEEAKRKLIMQQNPNDGRKNRISKPPRVLSVLRKQMSTEEEQKRIHYGEPYIKRRKSYPPSSPSGIVSPARRLSNQSERFEEDAGSSKQNLPKYVHENVNEGKDYAFSKTIAIPDVPPVPKHTLPRPRHSTWRLRKPENQLGYEGRGRHHRHTRQERREKAYYAYMKGERQDSRNEYDSEDE